jgi:hypothetical protein
MPLRSIAARPGRGAGFGLVGLMLLTAACSSGGSATKATARVTPAARAASRPQRIELVSTNEISAGFGQGIAKATGGWIVSGTNVLARTDEAMNVLNSLNPAIPADWAAKGFNHVGDIDVVGNVLYAPFEQSDYAKGEQAMARYDATTLAFRDAVIVHQSHNSFVAVDPVHHIAYSTNLFDDRALVRYDLAHAWKPLSPLRFSQRLVHIQGGAVGAGAFWISTNDPTHGVFRVDLTTGRVQRLGGTGHDGGEGEGIAYAKTGGAVLHTLTLDANITPNYADHWKLADA